jgi:hypothetical protein
MISVIIKGFYVNKLVLKNIVFALYNFKETHHSF